MSVASPSPVHARRPAVRGLFALVLAALLAPLFVVSAALVPGGSAPAEAATLTRVEARGLHAVRIAASKRGAPYRYGAEGPRAFDCSGYTHWVFARVGKRLPRTSSQQYGAADRIRARDRQRGDLVFFHSGGGVYHVGIYAGHGRIWHAPHTGARVRMERIWTRAVSYGRVR